MYVFNYRRTGFYTWSIMYLQSFTRLIDCFIKEESTIGITTIWLVNVTIFCLIWGIGSTVKSESRAKFDTFFRQIIYGNISQYPKPATFKVLKSNLFPEHGTVYDYVYDKKNYGSWILWSEKLDMKRIPPDSKVKTAIKCNWNFILLPY